MRFIGRKNELHTLNTEYNRNSSFVVIYGRRRVGKTTLIKEFLKNKTAFYYLATEELESQSMKRLANVIARTTKKHIATKNRIYRLVGFISTNCSKDKDASPSSL